MSIKSFKYPLILITLLAILASLLYVFYLKQSNTPTTPIVLTTEIPDDQKNASDAASIQGMEISESDEPEAMKRDENLSKVAESNIETTLIIFIVILFIVILLLLYFLVVLYRWRRRLNDGTSMILPDIYLDKLKDLEKMIIASMQSINDIATYTVESDKTNKERLDEIFNSFNTLQKSLDLKESENIRLKNGYDNSIKKRFALAILSLKDRVEFYLQDDSSSDDIKKIYVSILRVVENYLEENEIIPFSFDEGENIRKVDGAKVTEKIPTKNQEEIGIIIETQKNGYLLKGGDDSVIIVREASVKAFIGE